MKQKIRINVESEGIILIFHGKEYTIDEYINMKVGEKDKTDSSKKRKSSKVSAERSSEEDKVD